MVTRIDSCFQDRRFGSAKTSWIQRYTSFIVPLLIKLAKEIDQILFIPRRGNAGYAQALWGGR
jgi:hypothetical protein